MQGIDEFFARYEQGANTFDVDLITSQFTHVFMGADPNGVMCGTNDDAFRADQREVSRANSRQARIARPRRCRGVGSNCATCRQVIPPSLDP